MVKHTDLKTIPKSEQSLYYFTLLKRDCYMSSLSFKTKPKIDENIFNQIEDKGIKYWQDAYNVKNPKVEEVLITHINKHKSEYLVGFVMQFKPSRSSKK